MLHLLIVPADGIVLRADLETRLALALHRLNVSQRRLHDAPSRLLNPLWRRHIAAALHEVASLLFDRLRTGRRQEAIVERVLAGCIDERRPYVDAGRCAEGRQLHAVREELARVRAEIETLKRFQSRRGTAVG